MTILDNHTRFNDFITTTGARCNNSKAVSEYIMQSQTIKRLAAIKIMDGYYNLNNIAGYDKKLLKHKISEKRAYAMIESFINRIYHFSTVRLTEINDALDSNGIEALIDLILKIKSHD